MQFRVVIPPHVSAGQTIRIRCPDGTVGDVKVPKGLKPGDSFIFEMPTEALASHKSKQDSSSATTKFSSSRRIGKGFLDREIVDVQDFAMALGVGLLIGGSIVFGFLVGVLYVTEP
mmetsp:Transcript_15452/g.21522  ORF Transcript_15452/g.21522 Transcript_15452/m.21522 type:complete len:116 (+) Transcript_15452:106-453(+)